MVKLHIDNRVFELPASWNELSKAQLLFLARLVLLNLPVQEIKVKLLLFCIGAKARKMKMPDFFRIKINGDVFAVTTDQITQVSAVFDFLFSPPDKDGKCFPDVRLTKNHFPTLKLNGRKFFAPADALTDLLYNQYIYLQTYDYMQRSKPEAVFAWLGCFFLPRKAVFNPELLNIPSMKKIKPEVALVSQWFWDGSCRFIADKFPRIFAPDGEEPSGNPYDAQQRLLDYLSKADPVKKKLFKSDSLYNILYSLDYLLEQEENNTTQ